MSVSSWQVAPDSLPLRQPEEALADFGRTVIVAPHPDDETLGCGGLIAMLQQQASATNALRVIVMTDGTGSHPASVRFPAAVRRDLREAETLAALAQLGIPDAASVTAFLRLPDGNLPSHPDHPQFAEATAGLARALRKFSPQTLLVPWRRDPHPDHRATFQLVAAAMEPSSPLRVIEYPVWLWERAAPDDLPAAEDGMCAWRLDISAVLAAKIAAIHAHRSQTTDLIDDDPDGFRLAPSMLAHFSKPWELFLESSLPFT